MFARLRPCKEQKAGQEHILQFDRQESLKAFGRKDGVNVYYSVSNPKIVKACGLVRDVLLELLQKDQSIVAEAGDK
jgi:hypothetical protein